MAKLVARQTFPYANGTVISGQRFEARSEFDAVALTTTGQAVRAPADTPAIPALTEDDAPIQQKRRRRDPIVE